MELDVTDPEFVLEWPKEIFKAETLSLLRRRGNPADAFDFLLEEAFAGSTPASDFRMAVPMASGFGGSNPSAERDARALMASYLNQLGKLRVPGQRMPYWHESRLPAETKKLTENLQVAWRVIVSDLEDSGYFYRDIQPCVDGSAWEEYTFHMENKILRTAGLQVKWPLQVDEDPVFQDENRFYGLVECLADLVARPRARSLHSYGDCGWHYSDFYFPTGQAIYAWKVNALFERSGVPLALETQGELRGRLVRTTDASRQDLVERAARSPDTSISGRVVTAVNQYRLRGATAHDKRSACTSLAAILEKRRPLLKEHLFRKDEGALFRIANEFEVRHYRADEELDYDVAFLDWIFWWFLATVDLTETIIERQNGAGASVSRKSTMT